MLSRRAIAVGVLSLIVTSVTAAPVSAQGSDVRRPFRGLFGGPSGPPSPHVLTLSASVFAAYDDNVTEALTNRRVRSPWFQDSGEYYGANAGLNYTFARDGERFDFGVGGAASLNYYLHGERSDALPAYQANMTFGARLTRSLALMARQSAAYSSTYSQALMPEAGEGGIPEVGTPMDPALDLFEMRAIRSATSLLLTQELGRHASIRGGYQFRTLTVDEDEVVDPRFRDYETHSGSAGFHYDRPVTRYATLQLGYGIRASDRRSGTGEPQFLHNIDAGVNYARALSFSRRTTLSFGTGSAIAVSEPLDPASGGDREGRTRVRLTGRASLVHELGRTWTAQLTYARGFRNHDGFDELFFTDAVDAGVGGLISRRLSFAAGASWADSSIEYRSQGGREGRSASAQLQYGLNRLMALYASYSYYHYRYSSNVPLDERFPRQLDRHGVRVGLTTSVPLIR
jgi:hypothetical protein